jgi:uncharacterized membrane-anchored protein YhcB (DUF1043 family)
MYSLAWLVVVGVTAAVAGVAVGYLVAQVRSRSRERIRDLEAELSKAQDELAGYRREVFEQFAETARKFKTLDESYSDLHRQLASSASLLCGEAAGPLLAAPPRGAEITAQAEPASDLGSGRPAFGRPASGRSDSGRSDSGPESQGESAPEADAETPIVVAEAEDPTTGADPQPGDEDSVDTQDGAAPRAREAG